MSDEQVGRILEFMAWIAAIVLATVAIVAFYG